MDKRVEKWINEHDGDEYCNYCKHQFICSKRITLGPDGPIYPPCYDGEAECFIDEEALIEAIENGDE